MKFRRIILEENGKNIVEIKNIVNGNDILEKDVLRFINKLSYDKGMIDYEYFKKLVNKNIGIGEIIEFLSVEKNRIKYIEEIKRCLKNI